MEYDNEERNDSEDRVGKWAEYELGVSWLAEVEKGVEFCGYCNKSHA